MSRKILQWCSAGSLLLLLVLAACNSTLPPPPSNNIALNQLPRCSNEPATFFQDDSQSPPTILTDWQMVKSDLGFTIFLPTTFPKGTCLVKGHAIVHDQVVVSQFSVSYLLSGNLPLAISETPLDGTPVPTLQCLPDASNKGSLECLGSIDQTSIVFDSSATDTRLQTLFKSLKPNVDWIPRH